MSKSNTVKLTLDLTKPPLMTDAQKTRLAQLDAMPDDQIDTRDAPFRPDAVWVKAVNFPHSKKLITIRIDEDVIDFFKHTGSRYQTRMNAVLRSYVNMQKSAVAR